MRDYIIMTDSCCDLSQQEVEELELTVLPLSFTIEGKTLLNTPDHADMSPEEFFRQDRRGRGLHDRRGQRRPVHRRDGKGLAGGQGHPLRLLFERAVHNVSVRLHRGGRPARKSTPGEDLSH